MNRILILTNIQRIMILTYLQDASEAAWHIINAAPLDYNDNAFAIVKRVQDVCESLARDLIQPLADTDKYFIPPSWDSEITHLHCLILTECVNRTKWMSLHSVQSDNATMDEYAAELDDLAKLVYAYTGMECEFTEVWCKK